MFNKVSLLPDNPKGENIIVINLISAVTYIFVYFGNTGMWLKKQQFVWRKKIIWELDNNTWELDNTKITDLTLFFFFWLNVFLYS